MTDFFVGLPPESKWRRLLNPMKRIHPGVQAAIVAGIFSILGLWLGSRLESTRLRSKAEGLEAKASEQAITIQAKDSEIQRLETLLTPFRTIALERYTLPEAEALRKLADQISELQRSDRQKAQRISQLENDLKRTEIKAEPCKLLLHSKSIKKEERGYRLSLTLRPTKNEKLGLLGFSAALPIGSNEKILDFWPQGAFSSGKDSKQIMADGKLATLMYSLVGFGYPTIDLVVSGPTLVQIKGNNDLETFEVDIK